MKEGRKTEEEYRGRKEGRKEDEGTKEGRKEEMWKEGR
jgi:hypothetical protein